MKKLDEEGDKRLIRGGRFLRATGLDELPQLINVWRGEMSWVGPRPCMDYEYAFYSDRHKLRCCGMPGVTGHWQVNGKNRLTFEQMVNLDLDYLRRQSPLMDVRIMVKTVPTLLGQVGSSFWERFQRGKFEGNSVQTGPPEAELQPEQKA